MPSYLRALMGACLAFLITVGGAHAQGRPDPLVIEKYVASLQKPDGSFSSTPGGDSTLSSTQNAIRVLGFVAGSIPDPLKCMDFLRSCADPQSGGFAQKPGGTPEVGTTAHALIAMGELNMGDKELINRAVAFLGERAKAYEEVRIGAAGLEAVGVRPNPDVSERWKAVFYAGRNADGTWGQGASKAFDSGGRAAGLLRIGLEPENRDAIAKVLKEAQQADGGWTTKENSPSDFGTSYRIMRALYLMKERPNLESLRKFVAGAMGSNGLYSGSPKTPGDLGTSYTALILLRWADLLEGVEPRVETAGFKPLFNGNDMEGWDGEKAYWSVQDGMLVGKSSGLDHNTFLTAPGVYQDFALKFSFRLKDGAGNSGVQFRSKRVPPHEMAGYQADIGEQYWGCLYDESRRNKVLANAAENAKQVVRPGDWNHYSLRVFGNRISESVNGVGSFDFTDNDADIAPEGQIATQLHAGGPMQIDFQNIMVQVVPSPTAAGQLTPGFHLRTLALDGQDRKYTLYLPPGYDGQKAYPVVMFLHGSGERGEDGVLSARVGLGPAIAGNPEGYPFIGIFPQARKTWDAGSDDARAALATLDEITRICKVDTNKVVLTGLSMGGGGSWSIGAAEPQRFSAIVPVCGYGTNEAALKLKNKPLWTLIGDADMERLLQSTRSMTRALKEAGSSVRYTEYRTIGHNSWDRAYNTPGLISWMLDQSRGEPGK